jgi:hypothetical protein
MSRLDLTDSCYSRREARLTSVCASIHGALLALSTAACDSVTGWLATCEARRFTRGRQVERMELARWD